MIVTRATHRALRSPFVDLLLGPHGVDRYLELVRPDLTMREPRAEILSVRRQTARSVTLTLRPNAAWSGFRAGQFVRVGVEIDGVRRTRTYSPAGSQHRSDVEALAAQRPNVRVAYRATREGGAHISAETLRELVGSGWLDDAHAAVCGPPALLDAVREIWSGAPGGVERVLAETFTPLSLAVPCDGAQGTVRFLRSERAVAAGDGTLLEQAEAAG